MYQEFFGLRESPFALTPDPRYLFLSEAHKEALASAVYGVQERKGFVLILGEVGTGKTTLIRHLLGRFGPNIRSVFVFNPAVSFPELLQLMLRDLELPCGSSRRVEMIDTLNDYLLKEAAAGRYVVVIIDEAQHLSPAVLEEVRMLSNLETARGKLIQILLVGQPELGDKLSRPELRQLRQRISLVAELKPLSYPDTVQYVKHRLEVAGMSDPTIFSDRALKIIHRASGGIPRLINVLCDKALVLSYGEGSRRIKGRLIKEVLKDWRPFERPSAVSLRARAVSRHRARGRAPAGKIAAAVAIGIVGAALLVLLAGQRDGALFGRIWHGLLPAGATGTVVGSAEPSKASLTPPTAALSPEGASGASLPSRSDLQPAGTQVSLPGSSSGALAATPVAAMPSAAGSERSREVVIASRDVFSEVVNRNYGRSDLMALDFVKAANPQLASIDRLRVGQRLRLPPFEPGSLVQQTDDARYRVHVMTVWDAQTPGVQKVRALAAKRGRQVHVVSVNLTQREPAYRVLVGDFADRAEAEAFYRDVRVPSAVSSQPWR
jgi:general secretion pathway protein A